jgi:formylglycine-generating enzyme required for sulfatase activity
LSAVSRQRAAKDGLGEVEQAFWLGLAKGDLGVTLPSEAEWEKAARGDGDGRIYPWGDQADPNCANYSDTGVGTTSAVGSFPDGASPYGILDLTGNVDEWTLSLWGKDWDEPDFKYPYDPGDGRENLDASREVRRVLRGGSFDNAPWTLRCASRLLDYPGLRGINGGFRVCVSSRNEQSE